MQSPPHLQLVEIQSPPHLQPALVIFSFFTIFKIFNSKFRVLCKVYNLEIFKLYANKSEYEKIISQYDKFGKINECI